MPRDSNEATLSFSQDFNSNQYRRRWKESVTDIMNGFPFTTLPVCEKVVAFWP